MLFRSGGSPAGIVSYDLCKVPTAMLPALKRRMDRRSLRFAHRLIHTATHTHTGPVVASLFGQRPDREYIRELGEKVFLSIVRAHRDIRPAQFLFGSIERNPFAFNRRYFMRDGSVVTNPGKGNPDIVGPEGGV